MKAWQTMPPFGLDALQLVERPRSTQGASSLFSVFHAAAWAVGPHAFFAFQSALGFWPIHHRFRGVRFLQTLRVTLFLQSQCRRFVVALGNGPRQTGDSIGVDPRLQPCPT